MSRAVWSYRVLLGQHSVFLNGVWFRAFPSERDARAFLRHPSTDD